jgi:hypothetical protein
VNYSGSESDVDTHPVVVIVAYWQSMLCEGSKSVVITAVVVPPDIEIA